MSQRLAPAAVITVLHVYETRHPQRLRAFMSEEQYEAATKRYVPRLEEEMVPSCGAAMWAKPRSDA